MTQSLKTLECMANNSKPLLLHIYSGRENGLMVVGDRSSLKALGQQLVVAADVDSPAPSAQGWPMEIAHPEVVGPYKDVSGFALSFHLEGALLANDVLPLTRRGLPTPLFLAVAVCATVGLFTIGRWVVAYVL
ncbi:MAG: hypothetical protein JSS57_24160 [Proteobacteria bacterium]|nr:hypothetical protein [Pseudomonadota bacterium]